VASTLSQSPPDQFHVPGYRDVSPIFRSERTMVHSAIRIDGNQQVVLKIVTPGAADAKARWRLQHEYLLLADLDVPGVVKTGGLIGTPFGMALELEHIGSGNLHRLTAEVVPIRRFLHIAIRLAEILTTLHDRDISHRDINPSNVMFHGASGEVWLIDFGLATKLAREAIDVQPSGRLEGTLGYLSPEQTGRMNRSVDRRTDFYSLGATLYQLLIGRPPFPGRDALELLHATVAIRPTDPSDVRPDCPQVVNDIVMRLLEKDAEKRYQSGAALVDDLIRCRELLDTQGTIVPFEIAATDRRGVFLVPEGLYGRDQALAKLTAALERSAAGQRAVVAIPGPAGVGKTALSRELLPRLSDGGLLANGVCNPVDRTPYAPLLQVLRTIYDSVLAGAPSLIAHYRERYQAAINGHGALLARLLPELEEILGPQGEVPEIPASEARERVLNMLVRLLCAYHDREHQLVLFFDDLQWADLGTLDVLARLLGGSGAGGPLIVLAWRDNEVTADHPLAVLLQGLEDQGSVVDRLEPKPLNVGDIRDLVADTLSLSVDKIDGLARRVHAKTGGNAFFVRQFLASLNAGGLLRFDPNRAEWTWSLEDIDALPPTSNVADLLALQLGALPEEAQQVLGAAACVGKRLTYQLLEAVVDLGLDGWMAGLRVGIETGLLLPLGDSWTQLQAWAIQRDPSALGKAPMGAFRFVHDSVYDAALALPAEQVRLALHARAGRRLLEAWKDDQGDTFMAAEQLNQAASLLSDEERVDAAWVNFEAGRRAKESAAFSTALHHLEAAIGLLGESTWRDHYDVAFGVHLLAAECLLMCPGHPPSVDFAGLAAANAANVIDRVAVQRVRIRNHTGRHEFADTMRLTLEALRWVGVDIPARPHMGHVIMAFARTHWRVRGMGLEALMAIPSGRDVKSAAAMQLLMDAAAPSYYISGNLMPIFLCAMVDQTVLHGATPTSAFGGAGFAFLQIVTRDDVDAATMWATYARSLVKRFDARQMHPKVELLTLGFVEARTKPLTSLIVPFLSAAWKAREVGDAEYTALCHFNRTWLTVLSGVELGEAARRADSDLAVCREMAQTQAVNSMLSLRQLIACLAGDADDPATLSGEFMDMDTMLAQLDEGGDKSGVCSLRIRQLTLTLLFGDTASVLAQCELVEPLLKDSPGSPDEAVFRFAASLGLCAHMRQTNRASGRPWRRVHKHLKVLRRWAKFAPVNHGHKVRLIEAEICDLAGQTNEAIRGYEEAIRLARTSGMLHEEAMCLEWAARASLTHGHYRNASALIHEARGAWLAYGCAPRLRHLAELDGQLQSSSVALLSEVSRGTMTRSTTSSAAELFDIQAVLKASRALSGEIDLASLLRTLVRVIVESAGASHGVLVLLRDGGQHVGAMARIVGAKLQVTVPSSPIEGEVDPDVDAVIRYVVHTAEPLAIGDVAADGRFFKNTADGPKSVLCVPAIKGANLVAVMYLQNDVAKDAFTEDRHEVVGVLCSQAAISIENAQLYGQLQAALERQVALTEAYGRFMPTQYLELLEKRSILELKLGDQVMRQITVMFADIRSFTKMAESIGPSKTFTFINRYLACMEPAIRGNGGFVNQYLGDGIMALFPGAPEDAIAAAKAMLEGLRQLNIELEAEGRQPIDVGIGLNTGPLMVGAIGGSDRMGRGIVGDVANVAAHIEQLTKQHEGWLLIGDATRAALSDPEAVPMRQVDAMKFKGRKQLVTIWEVDVG
jgi:predicted ATPase/class 3 adenylate cyclase